MAWALHIVHEIGLRDSIDLVAADGTFAVAFDVGDVDSHAFAVDVFVVGESVVVVGVVVSVVVVSVVECVVDAFDVSVPRPAGTDPAGAGFAAVVGAFVDGEVVGYD